MTGRQTHLAELADCERALGRPERAIDLYRGADRDALDKGGAIELLIVAAGARGDLGQHDAAVAMLQVRELTADEDAEWAARLRYAYADALLAAGRREEAREWFARAAAVDHDDLTDAAERLLDLDGVTLEDDSDEDGDEATAWASDRSDEDGDEPGVRADGEFDEEHDESAEGGDEPAARAEGESGEDGLVGEDPADEDWSEEHEDAARSRAVAFVDGVETAIDEDDDLDETDDLDEDDDLADAEADGKDTGDGRADVAAEDDEKAAKDEFVAEAAAIGDDPFDDEDGAEKKRPQA
jgi:tetratricopeptide (TPR) repeat protein